MQPLTAAYHDWLSSTIDENGVSLAHALMLDDDGKIGVYALDLTPAQIYTMMLREWVRQKPRELIFALDRFARPGQGTTLGDLVAGHHFVAGEPSRPFVIEYQHSPRIVRPIDWDNACWNEMLRRELLASASGQLVTP